ncbi:MAG: hypothetical protein ABIJ92_03925 [Candidatus Aenigmatarchaeota archaeon]
MAVDTEFRPQETKIKFEFDVPNEVIKFIERHSGSEGAMRIFEQIFSDGVSRHINEILQDLNSIKNFAQNPEIGLRKTQSRSDPQPFV